MNTFENITKLLMHGAFICEHSYPDEYTEIQNQKLFTKINSYLELIGMMVSVTNNDEGYYCSYLNPKEHVPELKREFENVKHSLAPLIRFLTIVQQGKGSDNILRPGDLIRLLEIQTIIEDTPNLALQLTKIANHGMFRSTSTAIDSQLKQVFKRLVEIEYLKLANPTRQIYVATSKWVLLIEQLRFINDAEKLSLEDTNAKDEVQAEIIL